MDKITPADLKRTMERPEPRDYGTIMQCRACEWRGPFYLMRSPKTYPGTARCPKCDTDEPSVSVDRIIITLGEPHGDNK
jgi:hypothetical protein